MKAETGFSWLSLARKAELLFFYLLLLFLPTQLGKHFWLSFSFILGQRVDYLSPTLYITDVLLAIVFVCFICRKKIFVHPFFSLTVLFFSLCIFFSQSPFIGWYMLGKFLEMSFLAYYAVHAKLNRRLVAVLLAIGVCFESALSLTQLLNQGALGGIFYFLGERSFTGATPGIANASVQGELILRPYGTFSHPNMLAGYLIIATLLIGYFLPLRRMQERIFGLITLIAATMGLALSLSRVNIATWILIGLFLIAITFHERISKLVLSAAIATASTLLLTVVFFPSVLFRISSFALDSSFSERILLAQASLTMILAHPFFGVGMGNFISVLPLFSRNVVILQPVHNIYLLIAAETGIIGFTIFLIFILFLSKKVVGLWTKSLVEEKNKLLFLVLAAFAILFSGFFDHYFLTLQQGQLLFALVIGLVFTEIAANSDTIRR